MELGMSPDSWLWARDRYLPRSEEAWAHLSFMDVRHIAFSKSPKNTTPIAMSFDLL
jgi:hypothetical protein